MKTRYKKPSAILPLSALLLLVLLFAGCENFVEVNQPDAQLTATAVFEDNATATAAMVAVYSQIRSNGLLTGSSGGSASKLGEYTDELAFYGTGGQTDASFYNNTVLPGNTQISAWWNNSFTQLYATNAVLEGVTNSQGLTPEQKDRLKGEALFVRGLLHFYLVNLFGDIPYVTTTDYRTNTTIGKLPVNEGYQRIEEDLLGAAALLEEGYITAGRVRPNKATVQALLARLYLYNGQWEAAESAASAILDNTALYPWETDIDAVFLRESTTAIWQLAPSAEGENSLEGASFIFLQGPPPVTALSEALLNAFENNDLRKSHWVKEVTNGTDSWYHAYKYKEYANTGTSVEYSVIFRTAEQYLIRAEARVHLGDLQGAGEDLNQIRHCAGLGDTAAATAEQLLAAVLQERKVELFTEGHRFFDLKRTGMLDQALSPVKPGWGTQDRLLPLPENELLLNPNLNPQNPGY